MPVPSTTGNPDCSGDDKLLPLSLVVSSVASLPVFVFV